MSFKQIDGNIITKKDLVKVFLGSIPMEHTWNYERMMNAGFLFSIYPALEKIYPDKEDLIEASQRHMEFYNTTPYVITLPIGIAVAMEEQRSLNRDAFDTESIASVKTAIMGPLAGIGDSFFWGTLRIIATGVGTSIALSGSILGPILFLLIYNIPALSLRYIFTFVGYRLGTEFVTKAEESGVMQLVSKAAGILGLSVAGAMTAEMVGFSIPITIGTGKAATTIQAIIDGIIPGLLPLLLTGVVYYLLQKKVKPITLMLLLMLFSIVGAFFGFLA
ncbi:MAG: PTS system mannose/fructose/sorbose family transporter subunit IID [Erysipelotrichaceae bacterium]